MEEHTTARTLIGYWHVDVGASYSHPQPLVDYAWERARRHRIVEYLNSGWEYTCFLGFSYCRFGCTQPLWVRTREPGKGVYREVEQSYIVMTEDREETFVQDASGYYIQIPHPLLNGDRSYCDDVWCWPEGLAHYVEAHGIRLPDEFVAHAAARDFRPAEAPAHAIKEDDRFWREWCGSNAPFQYEAHCRACNPPRSDRLIAP